MGIARDYPIDTRKNWAQLCGMSTLAALWESKAFQVFITLILVIIPWTVPAMGIALRCVLWFAAWMLGLNVAFSGVQFLYRLPWFVKVASAVGVTSFAAAIAYFPVVNLWRLEKAEALTGKLVAISPSLNGKVVFQIGPNAKAWFNWTGPKDMPQLRGLGNSLRFDLDDSGKIIANADVRDQSGNLIVEIINNEWRVSNAAWEKNYTSNALEVKDGRGRIVFQLRLTDRAEIQLEWWDGSGNGGRIVQQEDSPDTPDSAKMGFVIVYMTPVFHPDEPAIKPIFRYPARRYFGQLKW